MEMDFVDVGNPEMDQDHHALALLVEQIADVCKDALNPQCRCDRCPEGDPELCTETLIGIGDKMMALMLEHFHREHMLMDSLSGDTAAKAHCARHRRAHVDFSTRYNHTVAQIDARRPVTGIRNLHSFILEWIRSHALKYDKELAALLSAPRSGR